MADDEGWMMLEDDLDNTDVLPVFPQREFAELFYEQGEFGEEYKVEPLDLYEFMECSRICQNRKSRWAYSRHPISNVLS